jgi:hypothetical protein
VRLEWPRLWLQACTDALGLHLGRQLGGGLTAWADLQPHHSHQAAALERLDITELKLEPCEWEFAQTTGDAVHDRALDAADETYGQVEVCGRRPAKLWCRGSTRHEVLSERRPVSFRHGQPEEGANP